MNGDKKSLMAVLIALSIILVGLMLVCAQRQASQSGGADLSADDDHFRQELLEMLDLADDLDSEQAAPVEEDVQVVQDDDDDVLAFLVPEPEVEEKREEQRVTTPPATERAGSMGLSEEMFIKVRNDVNRLEKILAERNAVADSLRLVIEKRDARLRELEQRMAQGRPYATPTSSRPAAPATVASTPFMRDYQAALSHFESYRYQAAIEAFQSLLNQYADHKMADNCQYWIGECYFGLKQYQRAIIEFQKVFAYNENDKHDDAQLMVALSHHRIEQRDIAKQEFENFINTYPKSEYYGIAQRYFRNL
ncbi:tetratricopeptide repeat protein [candidate division KSB1 bacterium]|nr:tetratricopeptide repeat protein [candidate division KSB1 bacterium]